MSTTNLTVSEKIKIILNRQNISMQELADALDMTRQNLYNKLKRENMKEEDIAKIAKALNVKYEINFILPDDTKI